MPITPLPQATTRALGSSSAIFNANSVVKELVDNALDANALSVSVEISPNSLDTIQVRDNGSGIAPDDRELACKRNYTSKLRTIEDLRNIGGKTLGFRGQALASIVETSGAVQISTCTEGEKVEGEKYIDSRSRGFMVARKGPISLPIGTTVRVCDFLKVLPVRRQTEIKNAAKAILEIERILQSYTIARPNVRFCLKVLKSKKYKGWIYAPGPTSSIKDAISTVIGPEAAGNCITRVASSDQDTHALSGCINVSAIIPKPDFVIDKRPISNSKGIAKNIVCTFKSYLQRAKNGNVAVKNPFMHISIECSPGTYDINIEPSKDDALFENPPAVLELVNALFEEVYGSIEATRCNTDQLAPSENCSLAPPDFVANSRLDILHSGLSPTGQSPRLDSIVLPIPTTPQPHVRFHSRYGISNPTPSEKNCSGSTSNPWAIAKLYGRQPIQPRDPDSHLLTPTREQGSPERRASNNTTRASENNLNNRLRISRIPCSDQLSGDESQQTPTRFIPRNKSEHQTTLKFSKSKPRNTPNALLITSFKSSANVVHETDESISFMGSQVPIINQPAQHNTTAGICHSQGFRSISLPELEFLKEKTIMTDEYSSQSEDNRQFIRDLTPPEISQTETSTFSAKVPLNENIYCVSASIQLLKHIDIYIKAGIIAEGFSLASNDNATMDYWASRLRSLVLSAQGLDGDWSSMGYAIIVLGVQPLSQSRGGGTVRLKFNLVQEAFQLIRAAKYTPIMTAVEIAVPKPLLQTPVERSWRASHPSTIKIVSSSVLASGSDSKAKSFSLTAVASQDIPANTLLAKNTSTTLAAIKDYSTVQVSKTDHIRLNSDLLYCNHSCDPNVRFVTSTLVMDRSKGREAVNKPVEGALEVWSLRDIPAGEELRFFYPSTEWEMSQPFQCSCGAPQCLEWVDGAKNLSTKVVSEFWLSDHIKELLKERDSRD
ncbi:hypothetical protein FQN57_003489 [Myotisia sp. PD_48]|nr:hypothetical protein FQN57_003489 [Myotisia sp. PD_48]